MLNVLMYRVVKVYCQKKKKKLFALPILATKKKQNKK